MLIESIKKQIARLKDPEKDVESLSHLETKRRDLFYRLTVTATSMLELLKKTSSSRVSLELRQLELTVLSARVRKAEEAEEKAKGETLEKHMELKQFQPKLLQISDDIKQRRKSLKWVNEVRESLNFYVHSRDF